MSTIPGYKEGFPSRDVLIDTKTGKALRVLTQYMDETLRGRIDLSPARTDPAAVVPPDQTLGSNTNEAGTLGGVQTSGYYQVNAYMETVVEDPAGAPEAELTITWTRAGKNFTRVYTPLDGSAVANSFGMVDTIQIESGTPVGYVINRTDGATPGLFRYLATLTLQLIQPIGA